MKSFSPNQRLLRASVAVSALAASLGSACSSREPGEPRESLNVASVEQALAASANPPGGLGVAQVPQFVVVSFDDNFNADGFDFIASLFPTLNNPAGTGNGATFDGAPVRTSYFHNSTYLPMSDWVAAFNAGHEAADHTDTHPNGLNFGVTDWTNQIQTCRDRLVSAFSTTPAKIAGFRAPFLAYNDALYSVLQSRSPAFAYDSSIETCWGATEDGTNCNWPYTLDAGSSDAANVFAKFGAGMAQPVGSHPGLWELPVSTVIVPPDSVASQYGFTSGLRTRVQTAVQGKGAPSFYEPATGKLGGLDITLVVDAAMNAAEALATLKYTLDLHLQGNRSPFIFVAHTHVYGSFYGAAPNIQDVNQRRSIISNFINYALSKPVVRMRPIGDVLTWMKNPVALGGSCTPSCTGKTCGSDGCGGSCGTCATGQTCNASGQCTAGSGNCSAPAWTAKTYANGEIATSTCQVSIPGTPCFNHIGTGFAWSCSNPSWCGTLQPGSNSSGWWSVWSSVQQCN